MKHTFVVLILVALTSIPSIACEIEESLVNDAVATVQSEISVPIQTAVAEVNLTPIQSPEMAATTTADESTPEPVDDESTPEPVEQDLVSMIDPDSWGAPGGLGSGGSFGGVNQGDCVDLLVEYLEIGEQKGSELGVRQIMDLVASYTESQEGQIDCSDPAQLWDDIQDWLIKKLHIELPPAKITATGVYPVRDKETFVWNEEITLRYPTLHLSEIYAYDIDDSVEPAIGVPWLFDRVEYSWKNCDADSWSNRQSTVYGFSYRADILESEYSEDHRLLCIDVESETFGVHLDGSPAAESIRASERITLRPYEDREDRFVVIGLGDSYGSGEGNSAKALTLSELLITQEADFRWDADSPSIWWDTDSWPEEIITYTSHADSCHRSSESGLGKAVQKLARDFQGQLTYGHFACSGAVAGHLWLNSYTPDFWGNETTQEPQMIAALNWLAQIGVSAYDVDAIVVSVGGNDVHFADVIYDCFIEAGECYDETDTLGYRSSINSKIPRAVSHISHVAGAVFPNAEIFFTSYTDGISVDRTSNYDEDNDGVCSYDDDPWFSEVPYDNDEFWDILAVDSRFVKGFMERINDSLDSSVSEFNQNGSMWNEYWPFDHLAPGGQQGMAEEIVDMYPALRGRQWEEAGNGLHVFGRVHLIDSQFSDFQDNGFCTRDRRNIMFNSEAGDRQGYDQFGFWSSGGWHPNDFGYKLYGDAIAEALIEAFPQDYQNLRARR
jgi:hypothetical protein